MREFEFLDKLLDKKVDHIEVLQRRITKLEAENAELLLKLTKALKKVADLNVRQKQLVELLQNSVAEFDDGIKYPLEVVNDLKQVLANKEKENE